MLRSTKELRGYPIDALDGEIGQAHAFLFDEFSWTIRYLVVETGTWLTGRHVLLSPYSLGQPRWKEQRFPVHLTQEQIRQSPSIETRQPISRQQQIELHRHYEWPLYWEEAVVDTVPEAKLAADRAEMVAEQAAPAVPGRDPRLHSTREVEEYNVLALDEAAGRVTDFLADDESWIIRYLVIDTGNWLAGKQYLLATRWVERISETHGDLYVDLSREMIERGPEFDPSEPVNREYEVRLYDYYGRPAYWERT